jgi:hypothetical protein
MTNSLSHLGDRSCNFQYFAETPQTASALCAPWTTHLSWIGTFRPRQLWVHSFDAFELFPNHFLQGSILSWALPEDTLSLESVIRRVMTRAGKQQLCRRLHIFIFIFWFF